MKVVFLFSGSASSMKVVLESDNHGQSYQVVGAISNRDELNAENGYNVAKSHDIIVRKFLPSNFSSRENFYEAVKKTADDFEADIFGISGWLGPYSIISNPFLGFCQNRIINVHPADLTKIGHVEGDYVLEDGTGKFKKLHRYTTDSFLLANELIKNGMNRLYTGDDAVTMAILFGEDKVCSSIHNVTEECDAGPILVQSKRVSVNTKFVKKCSSAMRLIG